MGDLDISGWLSLREVPKQMLSAWKEVYTAAYGRLIKASIFQSLENGVSVPKWEMLF